MASPDRNQKLMIFFSADLVGATAYKGTHPVSIETVSSSANDTAWPRVFERFFDDFLRVLNRKIGFYAKQCKNLRIPQMWKVNGGGILLKAMLYNERQVACLSMAFYDTVVAMDKAMSEYNLGSKGFIWTAGFPLRNKEVTIELDVAGPVSVEADGELDIGKLDDETGIPRVSSVVSRDYIGIEIDAGFRLSQESRKGKVSVSIDVADFLTRDKSQDGLRVHHVGWRVLKDCFGNNPYPIFWISYGNAEKSTPWEVVDCELTRTFINQANGMNPSDVQDLIIKYRGHVHPPMIVPYVKADDMPESHKDIYNSQKDVSQGIRIQERDSHD